MKELGIAVNNALSATGRISTNFVSAWDALRPYMEREEEWSEGKTCPSAPTATGAAAMHFAREEYAVDYAETRKLWVAPTVDNTTKVIAGAWGGRLQAVPEGGFTHAILLPRRIKDGLSKTTAFVERTGRPTFYEARPSNHPLGPWPSHIPSDRTLDPPLRLRTKSEFHHHEMGPSHERYSGMDINRTNLYGLFSFHPGVNILMCDGSVHFISNGTAPSIMVDKFSRDGGPS